MAKWPDVPDVHGWLGLDRRGRWRLKGELITNDAANRFIDRNYACDEAGRWFFQNGPQRVFVTLEYTPYVYRLDDAGTFTAHTGRSAGAAVAASLDEEQNVTVVTGLGPGLVDDRDLDALSERIGTRDGEPLDDDTLEAALAATAAGRPGRLGLVRGIGPGSGIGYVPAGAGAGTSASPRAGAGAGSDASNASAGVAATTGATGAVTPLGFIPAAELPRRLGFMRDPAAARVTSPATTTSPAPATSTATATATASDT